MSQDFKPGELLGDNKVSQSPRIARNQSILSNNRETSKFGGAAGGSQPSAGAGNAAAEANEKQVKEYQESISANPLLKRIFTHVA